MRIVHIEIHLVVQHIHLLLLWILTAIAIRLMDSITTTISHHRPTRAHRRVSWTAIFIPVQVTLWISRRRITVHWSMVNPSIPTIAKQWNRSITVEHWTMVKSFWSSTSWTLSAMNWLARYHPMNSSGMSNWMFMWRRVSFVSTWIWSKTFPRRSLVEYIFK